MFNEATFQEILLPSSPDDGRSISRNVASLNILVHNVIKLLYYNTSSILQVISRLQLVDKEEEVPIYRNVLQVDNIISTKEVGTFEAQFMKLNQHFNVNLKYTLGNLKYQPYLVHKCF